MTMLKVKSAITSLLLLSTMQIMTWVSSTRIALTPLMVASTHHHGDKDQILQSPQVPFVSKQGDEEMEKSRRKWGGANRGLSRLGSRPPNCEHKCRECVPCAAIQVPTTTDKFGLEYANYEPEGWKCRCGSSYFSP